jgi:phosphate transport system substrate-binding protein
MGKYYKTILYFSVVLLMAACNNTSPERIKDTSTSGYITIAADDEFKPITEAEISVFMNLYPNTKIHPVYTTEDSAFSLLKADSVRLIVAGRKLFPEEETFFHEKKLNPEQVKIAGDALVLIVNNNNTDTLLSLDKVTAVFKGQDSLWNQMGNTSITGKINVVFDNENSGNSHYIAQKLMDGKKFPSYCFALHSNTAVINYVSANKNALGIVSLNWISNEYDTTVIRFLKSVKVLALSSKESTNPAEYFKPNAYYIETNQYPLCRDIYIISRESYTGLGSGFLSFVTSNKGQRIVFREGLLPIRAIGHTIHF